MPYRMLSTSLTWHWCHNCSGWPRHDRETGSFRAASELRNEVEHERLRE